MALADFVLRQAHGAWGPGATRCHLSRGRQKAVVRALIAAQKIDLERKVRRGEEGGSPRSPLVPPPPGRRPSRSPMRLLLLPLQSGRWPRSRDFGLGIEKGTPGHARGGGLRWRRRRAGRQVPGDQHDQALPRANIAAGVIRGGVASALTYAVGEAWIVVYAPLQARPPTAAHNIPQTRSAACSWRNSRTRPRASASSGTSAERRLDAGPMTSRSCLRHLASRLTAHRADAGGRDPLADYIHTRAAPDRPIATISGFASAAYPAGQFQPVPRASAFNGLDTLHEATQGLRVVLASAARTVANSFRRRQTVPQGHRPALEGSSGHRAYASALPPHALRQPVSLGVVAR